MASLRFKEVFLKVNRYRFLMISVEEESISSDHCKRGGDRGSLLTDCHYKNN